MYWMNDDWIDKGHFVSWLSGMHNMVSVAEIFIQTLVSFLPLSSHLFGAGVAHKVYGMLGTKLD